VKAAGCHIATAQKTRSHTGNTLAAMERKDRTASTNQPLRCAAKQTR
jgi:hypothetical protein